LVRPWTGDLLKASVVEEEGSQVGLYETFSRVEAKVRVLFELDPGQLFAMSSFPISGAAGRIVTSHKAFGASELQGWTDLDEVAVRRTTLRVLAHQFIFNADWFLVRFRAVVLAATRLTEILKQRSAYSAEPPLVSLPALRFPNLWAVVLSLLVNPRQLLKVGLSLHLGTDKVFKERQTSWPRRWYDWWLLAFWHGLPDGLVVRVNVRVKPLEVVRIVVIVTAPSLDLELLLSRLHLAPGTQLLLGDGGCRRGGRRSWG